MSVMQADPLTYRRETETKTALLRRGSAVSSPGVLDRPEAETKWRERTGEIDGEGASSPRLQLGNK